MKVSVLKPVFVAVVVGLLSLSFAQERDVTLVLPEEPNTLDPCDTSSSQVGRILRQNVTEALTVTNPETGEVEPKLATSWQQISPTTWEFEIREGVTFHNGMPLTAEAVTTAFNRAMQPELECHVLGFLFGDNEYEATATSEFTVELSTRDPDPILPTRMSFIDIGAPSLPADAKVREPVGTGPYRFVAWDTGQSIQLERQDAYWGDAPQVEAATYIWRTEPIVRASTVTAGEADIALNIAPQDAGTELDVSYPNFETSFLRIDTQVSPLDDIRVRQAINYAIDREALVGTVFDANVIPATQIILPSVVGYSPNVELYEHDPERARALIEEARADGVPVDTPIVLYGRLGIYPNSAEAMEVVQAMLTEAGLQVELEMMEVNAWLEILLKPFAEDRPPNLTQAMHGNDQGDAVFTVGTKFASEGAESTLNDPTLDELFAEAAVTTGDERQNLYQQAFEYMADDIVPVVPLFHMVGNLRVADGVNYQPDSSTNSQIPLSSISFE